MGGSCDWVPAELWNAGVSSFMKLYNFTIFYPKSSKSMLQCFFAKTSLYYLLGKPTVFLSGECIMLFSFRGALLTGELRHLLVFVG